MFWAIAFGCYAAAGSITSLMCEMPEPSFNPAYSIFATEEACQARLRIATLPQGVTGSCIQTDTVIFSPGVGFVPNGSIMVKR
jgi:hypothetical protein